MGDGSTDAWCLFCPGAPGTGKTTLCAAVIDHLSRSGSTKDAKVTYIFCNYRSCIEQKPYNLLASLHRRLVQVRDNVPQCVNEVYKEFSRERKLTIDECSDMIVSVCSELPQVYLVVDAVDECVDDVSQSLFKFIRSMQMKVNLRLMLTARFIPAIKEMITGVFGTFPQLEVRASDEDIRQYFSSRQPNFKKFLCDNQALCTLASDKVVEASGGMLI